MKNNITISVLYFVLVMLHFTLWKFFQTEDISILIKFYIYLTVLFFGMIILINVFNYLIPEYLGLAVLGLYFIIFMLAFIVKSKFKLDEHPYFRLHFIVGILAALVLITYNGIYFLKSEKKP